MLLFVLQKRIFSYIVHSRAEQTDRMDRTDRQNRPDRTDHIRSGPRSKLFG